MAKQSYFFLFLSLLSHSSSTTTHLDVLNPPTIFPTFPPVTITPTNPMINPVNHQYPPTQPSVPSQPVVSNSGQSWCVAKPGASQISLQQALDYACGIGGVDCSQIQQGGKCYSPVSLQNHASFAFNSYYQKNPSPLSCDFGGAASVVNTNPSTGSCIYQTASSTSISTGTRTPTQTTNQPPATSTQTMNQPPATPPPTQTMNQPPATSSQTMNQPPATTTPTQTTNQPPATSTPTTSTQTMNQPPAIPTPIIPTGGGITIGFGTPPAALNPSSTLNNPTSRGAAVYGFDGSPNGNNPTSSDATHLQFFYFAHALVATLILQLQAVVLH